MGQKITFIIAPAGCAFHHIGAISQSMKAMFVTEVYRGTCAEDLPKLIDNQPGHHAVFVNTSREALQLIYPNAEIIGYYDACRAAGVSPFHTGNGQLIAPLNHAESLAAAATETFKPRETYGVLMEVATERAKQISKGFDASQDDRYTENELVKAANVYALNVTGDDAAIGWLPWPWDVEAFRPEGRRADLIKAAALLVAEIERMDRAVAAKTSGTIDPVIPEGFNAWRGDDDLPPVAKSKRVDVLVQFNDKQPRLLNAVNPFVESDKEMDLAWFKKGGGNKILAWRLTPVPMCEFCHGLDGNHKTGCCRVAG